MVRLTLIDGTKKEITRDEMRAMSQEGMMEAFNRKSIINMEFYKDDGT